MNPYALLPLSGFVVNLLLAVAIVARHPRALANRLYGLLCLALAYWSIVKFAWRLVPDEATASLMFRLSAPGWCLLPSIYLHFVVVFTRAPAKSLRARLPWFGHAAGVLFAATALLPSALLRGMVREPWGYVHIPGPAYRAFSLYFIATFIVAIAVLVRARAQSRQEAFRTQCGYLVAGILWPLLGGVVTNMLLPMAGLHVLELGEVLSTLNAAVVGYAMIHRGLLAVSLEDAAETIIHTMGDALLVLDPAGSIVLANDAAQRLLGMPGEKLLGRPAKQFVRAPEIADLTAPHGVTLRPMDAQFLPEKGEPVSVLVSLREVRGSYRELLGRVLVAKDIREMRQVMNDLSLANAKLERQAVTDELTGVSNRRDGNQRLAAEFARAKRHSRPLAVGIVDLDGFKTINDTLGHPVGDDVLKAVASALRGELRTQDMVARWGGDEFLVLLTECDAEAAKIAAERLLRAVRSCAVPGGDCTADASIGFATSPPDSPLASVEALVRLADEALYEVKRSGKGGTVVITGPREAHPKSTSR